MRLLVVEDDPILAEALVEGLRNDGYAVDHAESGDDAQFLFESHGYDCILLDIMLPGKDGWELLRTIRSLPVAVPVVCLTARDAVTDRVKGLDLGADDYVLKPFAWEELRARLRTVIRRAYGRPSDRIVIDDLEIQPASRTVTRGGLPIRLTAMEFSLLHYLALRQGHVVSRAEIIEHLYADNQETMSNVVDVFVGTLRAKIDRSFEQKLIHTRRGQGYVLEASEIGDAGT